MRAPHECLVFADIESAGRGVAWQAPSRARRGFRATGAARALVFDDVTRLFGQRDRKVACLSLYLIDFGIGEHFDVGMPADLDQFR